MYVCVCVFTHTKKTPLSVCTLYERNADYITVEDSKLYTYVESAMQSIDWIFMLVCAFVNKSFHFTTIS